jgi:tol-pal system protein YbgF
MKTFSHSKVAAAILAVCSLTATVAHAGIFDDDDARRAILDIRAKIDAANARIDGKADKNSALSLSDQNDQLRQELSHLTGQVEVLQNSVDTLEQRQKDFYADLDGRLRKMEPQQVQVDGQTASVDPREQKVYDAALESFKSGDYNGSRSAFTSFLNEFPQSAFAPAAQYWVGNSLYALRDYKGAIAALQQVPAKYPDNPKAADALLVMSTTYAQLKDNANAKRALDQLLSKYPNSSAADAARQRSGAR